MKVTNLVKVLVLGGIAMNFSFDAFAMRRGALGTRTAAGIFAAAEHTAQKAIYDLLVALSVDSSVDSMDEDAIVAGVAAAVGNVDVFARSEVKSMIGAVATTSFNKHLEAVASAMTADFSGDATSEITAAGEAYGKWINVFSADGGDSINDGCDFFATAITEAYDCIQGLIDAQQAHRLATQIVTVKSRVDALKQEISDGDAAHGARVERLSLLGGQLETEHVQIKSEELALMTRKGGRDSVSGVAAKVKIVAGHVANADDL